MILRNTKIKNRKNGVTYYYKEVKNDSDSETGKVKEGTTTVKYVYEKQVMSTLTMFLQKGRFFNLQLKIL